ncbi:MAG: NUDIX hydrolase [Candidatus Saccharimonadales bacterium]
MKQLALAIGRVVSWLAWPAYQVYFRRGARTRVLLVSGDEILVLKGWINDGTYILPGGGLHTGEDPLIGALRETHEETGLQLQSGDLTPLGTDVYRKAGLHFTYYMFFAVADKNDPLTRQWYEVADIRWVPLGDLAAYNPSQEVLSCLRSARQQHLLQ